MGVLLPVLSVRDAKSMVEELESIDADAETGHHVAPVDNVLRVNADVVLLEVMDVLVQRQSVIWPPMHASLLLLVARLKIITLGMVLSNIIRSFLISYFSTFVNSEF